MKRMTMLTLGCCCSLLLMAQNKIGYVNKDAVMVNMTEYKRADSLLRVKQISLQKQQDDLLKQFKEKQDSYNRDMASQPSHVLAQRKADLQKLQRQVEEKQNMVGEELNMEKERLWKPVRDKLILAIQTVAKENGYGHIFNKEDALVSPAGDDITGKVKLKLGIK